MNLPDPPDAIFSVEDFSALGLMKRLKERNIQIPGEVGIIGFANESLDEHITPTLSSRSANNSDGKRNLQDVA